MREHMSHRMKVFVCFLLTFSMLFSQLSPVAFAVENMMDGQSGFVETDGTPEGSGTAGGDAGISSGSNTTTTTGGTTGTSAQGGGEQNGGDSGNPDETAGGSADGNVGSGNADGNADGTTGGTVGGNTDGNTGGNVSGPQGGSSDGGQTPQTVEISRQPVDCTVVLGGTATFTVEVTGETDETTYKWQASVDDGSEWTDLTADSAVLTVEVVDEGMHGNLYRCVVTDGQGGQTVSSVAGLWVATANALMLTEAEEKTVTFSVTAFDMDGGEKVYNEFGGKLKALIGSDYTYKDVIDIGITASGGWFQFDDALKSYKLIGNSVNNYWAGMSSDTSCVWNVFVNGNLLAGEDLDTLPESGDVINLVYMAEADGSEIPGDIDTTPKGESAPVDADMVNALALDTAALTIESLLGENTDPNNIETDLILPTGGKNGTSISWTTDNYVINAIQNGKVNRESIVEPTRVTLTAFLTFLDESETLEFSFVVPPFSSDESLVVKVADRIMWSTIQGENKNYGAINRDLTLPTEMDGATITWTSSEEEYIDADGTLLQRPAYGAAGVPVTLTARVQKGGFWREVEQPVTVAPYNDEWKAVHSVSEALVLEGIDNLTQSLTLPTSLVDDETGKTVSITWVTNNDAVISSTGQISRPGIGEPAKSAELTATFVASVRNRYEERVVKTYAVTLAPLGEEESQAKNAAKAEAEEALAAIPNADDIVYENQSVAHAAIAAAQSALAAARGQGWLESEIKQFSGYGRISLAQEKLDVLPRDVTISVLGADTSSGEINYDVEDFLPKVKVKVPADMSVFTLLCAINTVYPELAMDQSSSNWMFHGLGRNSYSNYRWHYYTDGGNLSQSGNTVPQHNTAIKLVYLPYGGENPNQLKPEYDQAYDDNHPLDYDFADLTLSVKDSLTEAVVLGDNKDAGDLFTDLALPSDIDGAKISWQSSDHTVMSDEGKLINYSLINLDTQVTMTATIEKTIEVAGSVYSYPVQTKELYFTVRANDMSDDEKSVRLAADELSLGDTSMVTEDLLLPSEGVLDTTITWESANPELVSNSGVISRPAAEKGNQTTTLTATVSKNGVEAVKEFSVTVRAQTATGQRAVDIDYDWLTFDIFKGRNRDEASIRHDMELPSVGEEGSTITWTSSLPASISAEGVVTKNRFMNRGVTLTAKIENDGASREKSFQLTVPSDMMATKVDAIDAALDAFDLVLDPLEINEVTRDQYDQKERIKEAFAAYDAAIAAGALPADLPGYEKVVQADEKMRSLPVYIGISIMGNVSDKPNTTTWGFFREKTKIRVPAGWTLMDATVAVCDYDDADVKLEFGGGYLATMYGKGPWMYAGITDVEGYGLGAAGYVLEHNDTVWWYSVSGSGNDGGLLDSLEEYGYKVPFDKDAPVTLDFVTEEVDKSALAAKIGEGRNLNQEDYRDYASWSGSWEAFQEALAYAEKVNELTTVVQSEVDQAYNLLVNAIDALEPNTPDFTLLQAQIQRAKELNAADYKEGWDAVETALANAEIIAASNFSNKQEIAQITNTLKSAIDALVPNDVDTDKTALRTLLAEATQLQEADYTAISWRGFALALESALTVEKTGAATQQAVDDAVANLKQAMDGLLLLNPEDLDGKVAVSIEAIGDLFIGSVSPWEVMDMAYGGRIGDIDRAGFVKEAISAFNSSTISATDIERTIIALTSIGVDASKVEDGQGNVYNFIDRIVNIEDDLQVNALAFALLALDSGQYEVPADAKWTREALIQELLDTQIYNQGWNWSKDEIVSDVDMTAMVVAALAPYYTDADVKTAVDNAINYLHLKQGYYGAFGDSINSNSTAMVIIAATALGLDPAAEFEISGQDPVSALFSQFMTTDKLFGYTDNEEFNRLATEQVFRALLAYDTLQRTGKAASPYVFAPPTSGSIVDKTELEQKIAELEAVERGDYNETHWNSFQQALAEAKQVATAPTLNQTQEIVDEALTKLMVAYRTLTSNDTEPPVLYTTVNTETVSNSRYTFTAYALDEVDGRLPATVTVNGIGLTNNNEQFAAALASGQNIIVVSARDYSGNRVEQTYYVTYKTGGSDEDETITVYFTLNGAKKEELPSQPLQAEEWIKRTAVTVEKGARVYDVFEKVLNDNGIEFEETQTNYIGRIKSPVTGEWLSEFTNGPRSGWKYMVNGKYPNVGLRSYKLSSGDDIVWVYTNDYTQDPDYNPSWGSGSSAVASAEVTVNATVNAQGAATVTVESSAITKALDKAVSEAEKANDGSLPEVKVTVGNTEKATSLKTVLAAAGVSALVKNGEAQITIESSLGSVSLDQGTLKGLPEGYDAVVTIGKVGLEELSAAERDAVGTGSLFVLDLTVADETVERFGGTVSMFLPCTLADGQKAGDLAVYRLNDDGSIAAIAGTEYDGTRKGFIVSLTAGGKFFVGLAAAGELPFTDVNEADWYHEAIKYVYDNELMNGTGDGLFEPNTPMTRAMLVTALYRQEDSPDVTEAAAFADVPSEQWYTDAVAWAAVEEIVEGYGDDSFGPEDLVTREQAVTLLMRYEQINYSATGDKNVLDVYTDVGKVSDWAADAMAWAVAEGLIQGRDALTLAPNASITRAEVAMLLFRFFGK